MTSNVAGRSDLSEVDTTDINILNCYRWFK